MTLLEGFGYIIFLAEFLFAFSTFYYLVNILTTIKREGIREFVKNSFHVSDVFTVFMSILALILYGARNVIVRNLIKRIEETRGNVYIRSEPKNETLGKIGSKITNKAATFLVALVPIFD